MFNPLQSPIAYLTIALTLAVTLYQFNAPVAFTKRMVLTSRGVIDDRQYLRLLSHGFIHGGGFHLLLNMVTLFFFGPPIERILGWDGFVAVYFGSMLIAGGVSVFVHRANRDYAALGASGGVAGLIFSYVLFAPLAKFYLFFIPIGIPAYVFAPAYLLYSTVAMGGNDNVGHEAHIAGALSGLALTLVIAPAALGHFLRQLGLV